MLIPTVSNCFMYKLAQFAKNQRKKQLLSNNFVFLIIFCIIICAKCRIIAKILAFQCATYTQNGERGIIYFLLYTFHTTLTHCHKQLTFKDLQRDLPQAAHFRIFPPTICAIFIKLPQIRHNVV